VSSLKTTNILNPSSTTNNIVLAADGSTTISTLTATTIQGTIKSGTAVASTSGTSIDFTGIPSWVKRITVMFNGVSTSGTSAPLVQLGTSSGVQNTGYDSGVSYITSSVGTASSTAGFILSASHGGSDIFYGNLTITLQDSSTGAWTVTGNFERNTGSAIAVSAGRKALSGTLDRVRITTVNGTDTFDAGSINILYEG